MAYNEGAIVQGTVVEMQPPVARVLSMEVERIEPLLGDAYADDADFEPGDDALAHAAARVQRAHRGAAARRALAARRRAAAATRVQSAQRAEYPSLIEMANKFESDLGVSGTTVEVVDAACKELKISTEGISVVERAHRAHDQLYGAPTQAAADQLDVEVSIGDGNGGGDSFKCVERELQLLGELLQADHELRLDDENDGARVILSV